MCMHTTVGDARLLLIEIVDAGPGKPISSTMLKGTRSGGATPSSGEPRLAQTVDDEIRYRRIGIKFAHFQRDLPSLTLGLSFMKPANAS